jgi:hypothetical protein
MCFDDTVGFVLAGWEATAFLRSSVRLMRVTPPFFLAETVKGWSFLGVARGAFFWVAMEVSCIG